jgi:flagellar biogenesis protein FliO
MPAALVALAPDINPAGELGSILLGVLAFVAIVAVLLWLVRRASGQGTGTGALKGHSMQVLDRVALNPATSLCVVRVGQRTVLISVGKDSAQFLCELDLSDLPAAGAQAQQTGSPGFWTRFGHNLQYNLGFRKERDIPPPPVPAPAPKPAPVPAPPPAPVPVPASTPPPAPEPPAVSASPVPPEPPIVNCQLSIVNPPPSPVSTPSDAVPGQRDVKRDYQAALDTIQRAAQVIERPAEPPAAPSFAQVLESARRREPVPPEEPARLPEPTVVVPPGPKTVVPPGPNPAQKREDDIDDLFDRIAQRKDRIAHKTDRRKG